MSTNKGASALEGYTGIKKNNPKNIPCQMHASLTVLGNVLSVSPPPLHRMKGAVLQGEEIGEE